MKKFLLLIAAGAMAFAIAQAVPAKRGFKTFGQADGKSVTLHMVGDEFHHSILTQDGLTVGRASDGKFYYRTASGLTGQMAHDAASRDAQELSFIAAHASQLSMASQVSPRNQARRASAARRKVGQLQMPTTGTPRIPVLVVNFADKQMSHTKDEMAQHYSDGPASAYQYFVDQSNGKYQPQYEYYGIYTLPSPRATYGGNDRYGNDKGVALMVNDAVEAAGSDVNWSQYDNDGDGSADVVIVLYAGVGEAQAWQSVPEAVWPCNWSLSEGAYYNDGNGPLTRNGVTIDRFAVFNETYGTSDSGTTLDGIGIFCHEFSHCLGLPDFYETNAVPYYYYGMDVWSLMDYGCYNNDGFTPVGYSAYEKNFMNWIDFITPTENTQYTLSAMNQKSLATDQAIRLVSPLNANEYFILENRQRQGWDSYIPDNGLLITHFTYMADRWAANTVNNESMQLATIIPADNDASVDNNETDCYGKTNHEFSATSVPASLLNMLQDGTLASYTGSAGELNKPVTEIVANNDGTVSLWYVKGSSDAPALEKPVLAQATEVTMNSFKISWTHNTTTAVTYTLQVTQNGTMVTAQTGITAQEFTITGLNASQTYSVTVKAVPVDATVASESEWSDAVTVTTLANTLPALPAPVLAEATNVTGESFDIAWTYNGQPATFTLQVSNHYGRVVASEEGITATTYSLTNLTKGETYTVKVKAVPVDATTAQESAWAEMTVTTLAQSVISVDVTEIEMTTVEGTETRSSFMIEGEFLDDYTDATIALNDPSGVFRLGRTTASGYSINGSGVVVNVYFTPTAAGTYHATATVTYPGLEPVVVNINGTATISKQTPVMDEPSLITPTSFRATWNAVPNVSSYTLYVDQQADQAQLLLHEDMTGFEKLQNDPNVGNNLDSYMANPGWTGKYVYLEDGGLRINARAYYPGWLITPELDLSASGGFVTVKFNANKSQTVDVNVKLTVKTDDGSEVVSLTGDATDYTVVLPCKTQAGQKITFEGQNGTNRKLTLHDIKIYSGDASQTANAPARASETGDAHSRVITGITDNSYVVTGLEQYGTFNYKVQAIYTDNTQSQMSNLMQVTLADATQWQRGDVNADGVVDIGDVNIIVNIMLGKDDGSAYEGRQYVAGEPTVSVSDINIIINIMLGKE